MTRNSKTILTAIAITAITSLFGATGFFMSTPALAVTQTALEGLSGDGDGETNDDMDSSTGYSDQLPPISGSVNVGDTIKNYINTSKKVSFIEAATTAQKQVTNGFIVDGSLDVEQGYLVYTFDVNTSNNVRHEIVIDAGNGQVLYKSDAMPVESHGMHEFDEH